MAARQRRRRKQAHPGFPPGLSLPPPAPSLPSCPAALLLCPLSSLPSFGLGSVSRSLLSSSSPRAPATPFGSLRRKRPGR
eukprot:12472443-Heterocapsa_arctica.AAC.1